VATGRVGSAPAATAAAAAPCGVAGSAASSSLAGDGARRVGLGLHGQGLLHGQSRALRGPAQLRGARDEAVSDSSALDPTGGEGSPSNS